MDKRKIIIILSVIILVLIVIGSSYAYFVVGVSERAERNIRVTTSTTDTLLFEMGEDLTFRATQSEFVQSGNNASGKTTAKAILKANNETNRATDHYYFYLDINANDFVYTSEEQTAELILTIKKPDNTYLTSIDGLEYVTVKGISGFDITESTDLIKIVENKEINATSANNNTTTETWELTITFVNLDSNQNDNAGRTFEAKMIMQKEKIDNLFADYIKNLYTSDGVNGLYLHDSDLANGAKDNSLRYAGADYIITPKAINAGLKQDRISTHTAIANPKTDYIVVQYCTSYSGVSCYVPDSHYNTLGYDTTSTHYDTMDAALEQAIKDGYLNSGNINNFVCFGSDESTCPADNLYRIIGVFGNHVKLIKSEKAGTNLLGEDGSYLTPVNNRFNMGIRDSRPKEFYKYYWFKLGRGSATINGVKYQNVWRESDLNTINLNVNYLNNIGDKWRNLITGNKYVVGGILADDGETYYYDDLLSTVMDKEINNPDTTVGAYYKGRVGLMYINDIIYSSILGQWTKTFGDFNVSHDKNWMYMGYEEFTLTRNSGDKSTEVTINGSGVGVFDINRSSYNTRPVFYLSSGAEYVSGNGTKTNPYRIS